MSLLISFSINPDATKISRRGISTVKRQRLNQANNHRGIILSTVEAEKYIEAERVKQAEELEKSQKFWDMITKVDQGTITADALILPSPEPEISQPAPPSPPRPQKRPRTLDEEEKNELKIRRELEKFFHNKSKENKRYILNPHSSSEEYSDFQSSGAEDRPPVYDDDDSFSDSSSSSSDDEYLVEISKPTHIEELHYASPLIDDVEEPEREEKEEEEVQDFAIDISEILNEYFPLEQPLCLTLDTPFIPIAPTPDASDDEDDQVVIERATHSRYASYAKQYIDPPIGELQKLFQHISYDNPKYWCGLASLALSGALSSKCPRCESLIRCGSCIYNMYANNTLLCKKCDGNAPHHTEISLDERNLVASGTFHQCSSINDNNPLQTVPYQGDLADDIINFNTVLCEVKTRLFGCQGCGIVSCERHYLKMFRIAITRIANHKASLFNEDAVLVEPFHDTLLQDLSALFGYNLFENANDALTRDALDYNESIKERMS